MMNSQPHRQFSLRELLALVLIVALAIGWWLDHRRLSDAVDDGVDEALAWRLRAGTLEYLAKEFGLQVTWFDKYSTLRVSEGSNDKRDEFRSRLAMGMSDEPSQSVGDWNDLQGREP